MTNPWTANRDDELNGLRVQIEGAQKDVISTAISVRDCMRTDIGGVCCSGWLVGINGAYRCSCWLTHLKAWRELAAKGREWKKATREDYYDLIPDVSYQPTGAVVWPREAVEQMRQMFRRETGMKDEGAP